MFDLWIKPDNLTLQYARSTMMFGFPLNVGGTKYNNKEDRKLDQEKAIKTTAQKIVKESEKVGGEDFIAAPWALVLLFDQFNDILIKDMAFSLVAVIFVFVYLIFHLRTCFLALIGISIVLFSFPFTVVITEGIGQVTYFGNLQVIAIYIVLGIAADDIFVFYDAWRQSKHVDPDILSDKKKRMAYAWRRALRAMAVTSATTSIAFLANAFSPVLPIKAFGIFCAVIIPLNYFMVVIMMPPAAIIYETFNFHPCCCCPRGKKTQEKIEEERKAEEDARYNERKYGLLERMFD